MRASFSLSGWRAILLDFLLLFLIAAALIRPFFKANYLDKWSSIESTFIGDARFLIEHWPHPQWQPLWYGGTRFDYIYPPALRYGTAVIAKTSGFLPVRAYHIYTAFFYCIGIAGVYLLVRVATGARLMAWLCALAAALMSPSFLFLTPMRHDAWMLMPARLGVLAKYGEGPHMTALALIPIAMAFAWLALETRGLVSIALAGVFCAAVVSNNFYGAIALLVFFAVLVWSHWITHQDRRIVLPAAGIVVLAYGLTAFWLVPSYFRVTAENLKYVSEHGTTWSIWLATLVAIGFAIASDKFARGKPERAWAVFVSGCVVFFSLNVLGNYYFNFRISGEPLRLAPELDLVYILAAAAGLRWMWMQPGPAFRVLAATVTVAAFATTLGYLRHAWHMFPLEPDFQQRVEYRIPQWVWENARTARSAPSGSVRFWFDAWHDLPQLGGGSDQGILNGRAQQAQWEINLGAGADAAVLWMQCLGVDAAYVADANSKAMLKDDLHPRKLDGVLPVIYDDQQGNRIYRVPRRYPVRARVVETARLTAVRSVRANDDVESLRAYADVLEKGPDQAPALTWHGTDAMSLSAHLEAGQSLVVQESYDPAWHAWSAGKALTVHKDVMGFITIDAPPGDHEIALVFVTPLENQIGRVFTALSAAAVLILIALGLLRKRTA